MLGGEAISVEKRREAWKNNNITFTNLDIFSIEVFGICPSLQLQELKRREKANEIIRDADDLFSQGRYEEVKAKYQEASNYPNTKQYASQKLNEINKKTENTANNSNQTNQGNFNNYKSTSNANNCPNNNNSNSNQQYNNQTYNNNQYNNTANNNAYYQQQQQQEQKRKAEEERQALQRQLEEVKKKREIELNEATTKFAGDLVNFTSSIGEYK